MILKATLKKLVTGYKNQNHLKISARYGQRKTNMQTSQEVKRAFQITNTINKKMLDIKWRKKKIVTEKCTYWPMKGNSQQDD